MKQIILNFFKFHLIPFITAIIFAVIVLVFLNYQQAKKIKIIEGIQKMKKGLNVSCAGSIQQEIELAASLQNSKYITLLGSSELTNDSPYQSYNFLPDSLLMPTIAFGHAYHQSFSMFTELLAMKNHIKKSKICVFISPGWFETEGTNIESFLEFVRPNFLKSIIHNDNVSTNDKLIIGQYISSNFNDINEPSKSLNYFKDIFRLNKIKIVNKIILDNKNQIEGVNYSVNLMKSELVQKKLVDFNAIKSRLQTTFISSINSNKLFINDEYFNKYLLDKNGKYQNSEVGKIDINTNQEFSDLKVLIRFLKNNNCQASFVIQPLSVHHYKHLDNYNELIDSIKKILSKNNFPYLNMFVTKKQDYEPGTLNDIMHIGDYGWMRVNEFLVKTYK